jgi:3-phosphoshikimate 1-carboxyvinyltransferase
VSVTPDKSICHRVLLLAAVAGGQTEIRPWPEADDCQRTLELVRRLGVSAEQGGGAVRLRGFASGLLRPPDGELFCGESGTTLRLAAGLLAGQPFACRLSAGPSLSRRPMRRIAEPLARMGAAVDGASGGGGGERYPPLEVRGRRPLRAIRYEPPVASAQIKSAVLLAGLAADGPTTVVERSPTRDHTERMLRCFGASIRAEGRSITVEPGPLASPGPLALPGDFSSAAFFLVAAACLPGSRVSVGGVSLNPTRTALLDALERMGAAVERAVDADAWEPRGTVTVEARPLRAIALGPAEVPALIDELPILMAAAACARGTTSLRGLGELRVKETDRIRSMAEGLRAMGVEVRESAVDAVEIAGGRLQGAVVESAGDHRTAMSLAVAGLAAEGRTTIRGAECVRKSFPDFFERLGQLAGSTTVKTVDKA